MNMLADQKHAKALAIYVVVIALPLFSIPLTSAYADCVTYSSTANRIRITCDTTFSHVASHINDPAVLENAGSGEYILKANLQIDEGKRLTISSADVSWLKITKDFGIIIYGYLDMGGVKVTSWDTAAHSVIDNSGTAPRAFIQWRAGDGGLIQNSEFAYLGFQCSGSCAFKRGISMETYGGLGTHDVTLQNSKFHHNYYAYYSNAAYNIILDGNDWHSNHVYNIDPHTGTHDMQITNNHLHDSYGTGIICSLDCYNILIEGNTIHDFTSGSKVGISFSRNMFNSIVRNNEVYNMINGIVLSESPDNEVYGNNIHDVTRGIYFTNPTTPDDGVTQNNHAHDNTIASATYGIIAISSPINTVTNNQIDSASVSYEYYLATDSKLVIDSQAFNDDRIRAGAGSNPIEIKNSGTISVNGGPAIDTNTTPFTDTLTSEIITVRSVTAEPEPEPVDETAPAVVITTPKTGDSFLAGTVHVEGTAIDEGGSGIKTVQVRVDSNSYQTATPAAEGGWNMWSIDLGIAELGDHRILARATDNAGNQDWYSVSIKVVEKETEPDTTRPAVTITSPATGATLQAGTVDVTGTASDNEGGSGVKNVQIRVHKWVDGTLGDLYLNYQTATPVAPGDWSNWSIGLNISEAGSYRIQARATDNAGNQNWHAVNVNIG